MPAQNEAKTIVTVLTQLQQYPEFDVLVVNDASSDNTAKLAQQAGATVISLFESLGAWGAIQTGLRYAQQQHYHLVITMDADGQHRVESLTALQQVVTQQQAAVAIGSCIQRGSASRHLAWQLFRRLSGLKVEDLTSGLRAYNKAAIDLLASSRATLLDYQDMGVLLLLRQAGLKTKDIPVMMSERQQGKSRIFNSWWRVLLYMLQTLVLILANTNQQDIWQKKSKINSKSQDE